MKAKLRVLIYIMVVVVLAGVYSIVDKATPIYNPNVDSNEYVAKKILDENKVVQQFSSSEKEMGGIAIKLKTDGKSPESKLIYELKSVSDGDSIVNGKIKASELKNGKLYKIKFDQVKESAGKVYSITLSLDEKSKGSDWEFFYVPQIEENSILDVDKEALEGTMIARTIWHKFDVETFIVTLIFGIYIVVFMAWLNKLFK